MQKNYDIEALRGYAVAITFVAHLDGLFTSWGPYLAVFWLGGGVDLFFSISGFLITTSLLQSAAQKPAFTSYAFQFWIRRAFRLWPAALFWSTLYIAIAILIIWRNDPEIREVLALNWLFSALNLQNIYIYYSVSSGNAYVPTAIWHYWSLSLEEQFYLIMPLVIFAVPNRKVLILPFLILAIWQSGTVRPWGQLLWFIRTDALFYGVVVALVCHFYAPQMNALRSALPRSFWQAMLWSALISLVALSRPTVSAYFMGYVAVSAGVIVFMVSGNQNLLTSRAWSKRLAGYVGARSYSLYLVHMPAISVIHHALIREGWPLSEARTVDQVCGVFIALLLSLALAEFSYRTIENPLRQYGRAISRERLASPA